MATKTKQGYSIVLSNYLGEKLIEKSNSDQMP